MTTRGDDEAGERLLLNEPERIFQIWAMTVSHSQLLLRSPGDRVSPRIDVLFKAVDFIALPSRLSGLHLSEVPLEIKDVAGLRVPKPSSAATLFRLVGDDYEGFLIAGSAHIAQDAGDYSAPSTLWPWELVSTDR